MAKVFIVRRSLIEATWSENSKNLVRNISNNILREEDLYFDLIEEAETEMRKK